MLFTRLAGVLALLVAVPVMAETTATDKPNDSRIRLVNIAKVLRKFEKANQAGLEIQALRNEYVNRVNVLRAELKQAQDHLRTATDAVQRKEFETKVNETTILINGLDKEAQEKLSKQSNEAVVRAYQEIKAAIADLAKANKLALVLCGPGPITPDDENLPNVAQLMLQTPALQPYYHDGIDMTDAVIELLNKRYPPKPAAPTGVPKFSGADGGS